MAKCNWCGAEFIGNESICPKCIEYTRDKSKQNFINIEDSIAETERTKNNNSKQNIVIICSVIIFALIIGIYVLIQSIRVDDFVGQCSTTTKIIHDKPDSVEVYPIIESSLFKNNRTLNDNTWFSTKVYEKKDIYFHSFYKISDDVVISSLGNYELKKDKIYYLKFTNAKKIGSTWLVDYNAICTWDDWNKSDEYKNNTANTNTAAITTKPKTVSHYCCLDGCYSSATKSIIGISGQKEWYCNKHYKELNDMLDFFESEADRLGVN